MARRKLKMNKPIIVSNNFSPMYNEGVMVVAQPPTRRTVSINMDESDGYQDNFFLSFPLMYFRIQYKRYSERNKRLFVASQLHVIFVSKNNKNVFVPPLPNIDCMMRVCIPLPNSRFTNIDELCREVISCFWYTEFNDGMYEAYEDNYNSDSLLGDHRKWHNKTKTQPNWIPDGRSLKLIVNFDQRFFFGSSFIQNVMPEDVFHYDEDSSVSTVSKKYWLPGDSNWPARA